MYQAGNFREGGQATTGRRGQLIDSEPQLRRHQRRRSRSPNNMTSKRKPQTTMTFMTRCGVYDSEASTLSSCQGTEGGGGEGERMEARVRAAVRIVNAWQISASCSVPPPACRASTPPPQRWKPDMSCQLLPFAKLIHTSSSATASLSLAVLLDAAHTTH